MLILLWPIYYGQCLAEEQGLCSAYIIVVCINKSLHITDCLEDCYIREYL